MAFITWAFNTFIFRDFILNFLINHYNTSSTTIIKDYLNLNFINQAPIFLLGCYLYFTLNVQPKKIEPYIFLAWILLSAGLRFFYNIEGFGYLTAYIALGMFVYVCIKANIRFKNIEKLGKNSYAIYLIHFLVLHYLQQILPLKSGILALLVGIALTTLTSYFLAFIIFKFIESNIQHFVDVITKTKITQHPL